MTLTRCLPPRAPAVVSKSSAHMSMGILVLALVVHDRPPLTRGSVRWMILMTERERLRFSGTDANMLDV